MVHKAREGLENPEALVQWDLIRGGFRVNPIVRRSLVLPVQET